MSVTDDAGAENTQPAPAEATTDENGQLHREVVVTITGAVEASSTYTITGPAGTKTTVNFTLEAEGNGDPSVVELKGTLKFGVTTPSLTDQVDARLGDPDEGKAQVAGYVQRPGE
jgi:hypothetical protein